METVSAVYLVKNTLELLDNVTLLCPAMMVLSSHFYYILDGFRYHVDINLTDKHISSTPISLS